MATNPAQPPAITIPPHFLPTAQLFRTNYHSTIDPFLRAQVGGPTLPSLLYEIVEEDIERAVTPEECWKGDPSDPPEKSAEWLKLALYIGKAYALATGTKNHGQVDLADETAFPFLKLPVELRLQVYDEYIKLHTISKRIFSELIQPIFIRAFFSEDSTPVLAARYIAAIILLTCASSLRNIPNLQGRGMGWHWMCHEIDEERMWGWKEIYDAVMSSEKFPRDSTDWKEVEERFWRLREEGEDVRHIRYIPQEVLDVLDLLRERVRNGEGDMSVEEVVEALGAKRELGGEGGAGTGLDMSGL
ncbi:hypothetical protein EJ08DRAFT_14873 [Tothia fuscella]|uniref:Uncharacterized protein n=1 Tax=Tothia fuscella TaxID=1048955 RepID=A0A9P4P5W7_9PEZI|nr:hypothetical protein EJ08DRAFT_14873 [Tothia fuscella]